MRSRRRLGNDLRRIVARAEGYRVRSGSAVVLDFAAVRRAREGLLGLAERLESTAPLSPRGLALVRILLTDVRSPLFDPNCEQTIIESLWKIEETLAGGVRDQIAV